MQPNLDKGLLYQLSKHGLELFILYIHVFRLSFSVPSVSPSPLIGSVRLTPYSTCSASILSGNSVFFSHNNSAGTVFSTSFSQVSDQRI